jgi:hypothetical protein
LLTVASAPAEMTDVVFQDNRTVSHLGPRLLDDSVRPVSRYAVIGLPYDPDPSHHPITPFPNGFDLVGIRSITRFPAVASR